MNVEGGGGKASNKQYWLTIRTCRVCLPGGRELLNYFWEEAQWVAPLPGCRCDCRNEGTVGMEVPSGERLSVDLELLHRLPPWAIIHRTRTPHEADDACLACGPTTLAVVQDSSKKNNDFFVENGSFYFWRWFLVEINIKPFTSLDLLWTCKKSSRFLNVIIYLFLLWQQPLGETKWFFLLFARVTIAVTENILIASGANVHKLKTTHLAPHADCDWNKCTLAWKHRTMTSGRQMGKTLNSWREKSDRWHHNEKGEGDRRACRVTTKLDRDRGQDLASLPKLQIMSPECSTNAFTPPFYKISQRSIDWHLYLLVGSSSKWSL